MSAITSIRLSIASLLDNLHSVFSPLVLRLLLAELPLKTAVKLAADITGAPRNALYDTALKLKTDEPSK